MSLMGSPCIRGLVRLQIVVPASNPCLSPMLTVSPRAASGHCSRQCLHPGKPQSYPCSPTLARCMFVLQVLTEHHDPGSFRDKERRRQPQDADQAAEGPAASQSPRLAGLDGPPAAQRSGAPPRRAALALMCCRALARCWPLQGCCATPPSMQDRLQRTCSVLACCSQLSVHPLDGLNQIGYSGAV